MVEAVRVPIVWVVGIAWVALLATTVTWASEPPPREPTELNVEDRTIIEVLIVCGPTRRSPHGGELDQLEAERQEIAETVEQLAEITVPDASARGQAVLDRVAALDLHPCFTEWSERPNLTTGEPNTRDIDVTIALTVLPSGKGVDAEADPGTGGPSLAFCLEAASTRVAYPRGGEVRQIKALFRYLHPGRVEVIPTIVGRRPPAP